MIARLAAASLAGLLTATSAQADLSYKVLSFQDLEGWEKDDHASALQVFLNTCMDMDQVDYSALCAVAETIENPRAFFELFFRPVLIEEAGKEALFTGYFEPELDGSLTPTARYRFPVYAKPREAKGQWLTREQIETGETMKGRGLEIAWVDDPVELFFLQIQGSGRIRLPSGAHLRVGYGGNNGHKYRSIGQELIRRGIYKSHQVSAQVIQNWVRRNPIDGTALLRHNPSYVFFRKVTRVSPEKGPLGAMNRSITALRSVAVDPKYTPLGAPVWVEKDGEGPMRRLMIAQDTGSAIKGAQRADIFFGTGDTAGKAAGRLRDPGRMYVLMPIQRAYASVLEEEQ
ncbi:Membrane-bound lytic murein transglycosylase A precursor [Thalassovita autumnalis]|uniref:peptidoglycan lytic exotransglycosylase n=1 Tax=Thalassovita autumnalis TaxID=2072972 RepID=A0A0P1FUU5_9RHOB|nr:murein transglycosylase A [Thalassovita autumnalis]CUH66301.1 Membrane-bound lytic murein transglycosylase A precursor [Thalassovita autumnalis]CUH72585.1 Membrane-bound lytic murein transglycosylase A precursor [Thalassovita autumnalis]